MIMANERPVAWFQINQDEYNDEGKVMTLLNIETLERNPLGTSCPKIALDFVEQLAKERDVDVICLDRPLQPQRTLPMLERRGYISEHGDDPRKTLKKPKVG